MPIKHCAHKGKPGFKWGDNGTCYTYESTNVVSIARAKLKAQMQGKAILHEQQKKGTKLDGQY